MTGDGILAGNFDPADTVVVTGAGSGIGRATALLAARLGLRVAAWDIDGAAAEATVAAMDGPGAAQAGEVDVTDAAGVGAAFAGLDAPARYLVNNAGPASAAATPFERGLVMGAASVASVTEHWLSSEPPPAAAVVNVASVAGNLIGAVPDWYSAAKAAIAGYTRHLAVAGAGRFRANAVAPGMIATPRSRGFAASQSLVRALERNPLQRMGEPEEVASVILFLLSPLAGYINGAVVPVDGGWTVTP